MPGSYMFELEKPDGIREGAEIRWHPEYVGTYAVSSHGHVISYHREDPKILSPGDNKGYEQVVLHYRAERIPYLVHHLVLETFDCSRPEGKECRHLNGVRDDNRIENLEWGTRSRNARDRYDHGRSNRGEDHPSAKLSNRQADMIVKEYEEWDSTQREIADKYGVSQPFVSRMVNGKRRRHLGNGPDPGSFEPYPD